MIDKTNYLFHATSRLVEIYDDLVQYALDDIVARILKNKVITGTAEYEIWKLQQMGLNLDKIIEYIKKTTKYSDSEIEHIFKTAGIGYYKSVARIAVDYGHSKPLSLQTSERMKNILEYYIKSTKGTVHNLTRTTAKSSQKLLIDKLDQVHFRVASGMQSHTAAISEAVDEISKNSLKVEYPERPH